MENKQICQMPNRLEINYNESTKLIYLSRCCFTAPFKALTYKELLDIDNLFSLSTKDYDHKRIPGSEASCLLAENRCQKIKQ